MLPMLRNATSTYRGAERVSEPGVSRNNGQAREKSSRADWSLRTGWSTIHHLENGRVSREFIVETWTAVLPQRRFSRS
jgi:hypothetical protein